MKIGIITDTHWGVRNDSQIFMKHFEKFYDEVFFPYLEKNNIKTLIHGGDIVDRRKYINFVTLRHLKETFIDRCIRDGIELHVVIGNHDVTYRNSNRINAMDEVYPQEYFEKHNIYRYTEPTTINIGDMDLCLIPWINSSNYDNTIKEIENTSAQVVIGHLELSGFEMHRGVVNHHSNISSSLFKNFDMVLSGHFHHKSTKGNITYLGSPYEMTWSDHNDRRGFHILDTETRELDFIQNPYRIFFKIVYDDRDKTIDQMKMDFSGFKDCYVKVIIREKTNDYLFDSIMDDLYKVSPANIAIVEDHKNIDQVSSEKITSNVEDTVTILNRYVENMKVDADKRNLQLLLNELYNEAQSMVL